jgi:hypothetical protein
VPFVRAISKCFPAKWRAQIAPVIEVDHRPIGTGKLGPVSTALQKIYFDVVRQPKAYPVYDDEYKLHVRTIRDYLEGHARNLQLVGRNGMHHYNNEDHSIMTALCAARNIALNANLDPWSVNTDAEYHEGTRDAEDQSGRLVPQRAR